MSPSEYEQLVAFLGRQFTEIDRRFDQVDGQIADLRREMLGHFDEIYRRLDRLEQEYHAITQRLRRIEAPSPTRAAVARSLRVIWQN